METRFKVTVRLTPPGNLSCCSSNVLTYRKQRQLHLFVTIRTSRPGTRCLRGLYIIPNFLASVLPSNLISSTLPILHDAHHYIHRRSRSSSPSHLCPDRHQQHLPNRASTRYEKQQHRHPMLEAQIGVQAFVNARHKRHTNRHYQQQHQPGIHDPPTALRRRSTHRTCSTACTLSVWLCAHHFAPGRLGRALDRWR